MTSAPARQVRSQAPRLVEIATRRARLSVVPRRRVRAPRVPFVTLVSLVLVGGVVGLLCFNTQMQQASFTQSTLQTRADSLTARQQTLERDLEQLRNPNRVTAAAQRAGLVPPASSAMLDLSTGKLIGVSVPASAANAVQLEGRAPAKPASLDPQPTTVYVPGPPVDPAAQTAADAAALADAQTAALAAGQTSAPGAVTPQTTDATPTKTGQQKTGQQKTGKQKNGRR